MLIPKASEPDACLCQSFSIFLFDTLAPFFDSISELRTSCLLAEVKIPGLAPTGPGWHAMGNMPVPELVGNLGHMLTPVASGPRVGKEQFLGEGQGAVTQRVLLGDKTKN